MKKEVAAMPDPMMYHCQNCNGGVVSEVRDSWGRFNIVVYTFLKIYLLYSDLEMKKSVYVHISNLASK